MKSRIIIAMTLATVLGACAPKAVPNMDITYEGPDHRPSGLIRAFVMNNQTVLQFNDVHKAAPKIFVEGTDTPIPYKAIGQQLAVIDGTPPSLTVEANGARTTVTVDQSPLQVADSKKQLPAAAMHAAAHTKAGDGEKNSTWTLRKGFTVGREIQRWADKAGWSVVWSLTNDWSVPANSSFDGDFPTAATRVIETLASNGVVIRARVYQGNKTIVVTGPSLPKN